MDAILPAAGLATRMRGLPKFLLPATESYLTLLELHVLRLQDIADRIWIPIRPEFAMLIESLDLPASKVTLVPMRTSSMSETVIRIIDVAKKRRFLLVMPDTAFTGEMPYSLLDTEDFLHLALWAIRPSQAGKLGQVDLVDGHVIDIRDKDPGCQWPYFWGAVSFSCDLAQFIKIEDPHIGYAAKKAIDSGLPARGTIMNGNYFDCGTASEYRELIQQIISL